MANVKIQLLMVCPNCQKFRKVKRLKEPDLWKCTACGKKIINNEIDSRLLDMIQCV